MFHEDRGRRTKPLVVALGLVVAVSAIAAAASLVQSSKRPVAPPTSSPALSTSGVAVTALQLPPANVPLIWFRDATSTVPIQLRAASWSGRVLGRLSVSCAACEVMESPDGQRLLIGNQATPVLAAESDRVFDSAGRQLSAVDGFGAVWADDSRHLCALRTPAASSTAPTASTDLVMTDVANGAVRVVGRARASADPSGNGSWSLLSCAVSRDRAVLAYSYLGVRALRVVQISSGRTLLARDEVPASQTCDLASCPISNLVVSGDGSLAVENLARGGLVQTIDLETGVESSVPPSWNGHGQLVGLSWNGRLAVTPIGVYAFPAGTALWQAPLPAYMLPVATDPRHDDVLLSLWVSSALSARPVIVRSDGTSAELPSFEPVSQPPLPF